MDGSHRPTSVSYFYGRIARDDAEKILKEKGSSEGLFLLRESMSTAGNYALSLCHNNKVHHYHIERQPDGNVMIQDGRKFPGPVELVLHHKKHQDGFLTRPTIPCNRPDGTAPFAYPGVTMLELDRCIMQKAESMGLSGVQLENVLGPQRSHFAAQVAKELHKSQAWFHSRIERDEADRCMTESGHKDGKYLIRERGADNQSYALSLSYQKTTKHYKIDKHNTPNGENFAIEDGPKFNSLMDMVAHYHNRADGLLCKLTEPCVKRGFNNIGLASDTKNPIYHGHELTSVMSEMTEETEVEDDSLVAARQSQVVLPERPKLGLQTPVNVPDEPDPEIYSRIPLDVFNLNRSDLDLHEKLGAGNFGSVMHGTYRWNGKSIPVAIKTLKQDEVATAKEELMREARLMANLQHKHVVRMIGVCQHEMIMLVLELAPLGPLHKYLKRHHEMSMKTIVELMIQVCEGMAFLESKNFVHRDLAARNVLLVNEKFAKISDFGMSKALGIDSDYYKAQIAGRWPLKWYAPECIYFFRFDSKSDVWSYGITLWEATSYGDKPYKGLKGNQILDLIDHGSRLDRPPKCPAGVYEVMLKCWEYKNEKRPNFKEVLEMLRKHK